jgi:hypothetical protein
MIEKILEQIKREQLFDKHIIEKVAENTWFCRVPGEGNIQSFYVCTPPGAVICYGDMGELIFTIYGGNPLRWGKRNFKPRNCYYPFTKISSLIRQTKHFVPKDADEWLEERLEEAETSEVHDDEDVKRCKSMKAEWKVIRSVYDDDELERKWWDLHMENGHDEAPNMRDYPTRVYWTYQCLCWFFTQVGPTDERFQPEWG